MVEVILTIAGTIVGIAFLATAGYFILRGQKATGESDASVKTMTMLSSQIAALTSAQQLADAQISHLTDLVKEKDRALERNERDITRLQEALTQRAEVDAFRKESRLWFQAIAKATGATEPAIPTSN